MRDKSKDSMGGFGRLREAGWGRRKEGVWGRA